MPDIDAKVVNCPETDDHTHKKILLVVNDEFLSVYCREHGWLKIELKRGGDAINFKDVSAKVTPFGTDTHLNLSDIPTIGVGEFKTQRKKYVKHHRV